MTYEELKYFINNKMRMSHLYQPVMLMTLLKNDGKCSQCEIASALLTHDESQIEYYTNITNNMVGRVLRKHGIVDRDNLSKEYLLIDFKELTRDQVSDLIALCNQKLNEFLDKRGKAIFDHRRKSTGHISGTIKYEVLKRAKFRCELCGISADEKALEVDHIIPRNKGGSDDLSNYQALCYSCNAMKRDRDDTDFREVHDSYEHREDDCLFCEIPEERIIAENELAYVVRDGFPVTELHTLIIPKRHVATYFELGQAEINALNQLIIDTKAEIEKADDTVTGFNIGINNGESAGQTIFHCHIHLIPRRDGDIENPRGGIRHVIPGKGFY
jgi:ATP adenylyltransferase